MMGKAFIVLSTGPGDDWRNEVEAVFREQGEAESFAKDWTEKRQKEWNDANTLPRPKWIPQKCEDYAWVEEWPLDGSKGRKLV